MNIIGKNLKIAVAALGILLAALGMNSAYGAEQSTFDRETKEAIAASLRPDDKGARLKRSKALVEACREDNVDNVKALLEEGPVDLEVVVYDQTALQVAIESRNHAIVDILLSAGAKRSAEQKELNKDFCEALDRSDFVTAERLLKNGAELGSLTESYLGKSRVTVDTITFLLDRMKNSEYEYRWGSKDMLSWALGEQLKAGNLPVATKLIEYGADINYAGPDYTYEQALHKAAHLGWVDTIKFMLKNGADVNAKNRGQTPLTYAVLAAREKGSLGAMETLLQNKANPNITDYKGRTVLDHAQNQGFSLRIISMLEDYGAKMGSEIVQSAFEEERKKEHAV